LDRERLPWRIRLERDWELMGEVEVGVFHLG
jgi:hypothetical protein